MSTNLSEFIMQSGNPALNKNTFLDAASGALVSHGDQAMTLNGTVNKTGLLLALVVVGAIFSWGQFHGPASLPAMAPLMLGGAIGGVVAATGGVLLLYVANFVMGLFGHSMGFISGSSTLGIGFSAVVVVIAALNLILDFDMIEQGVSARAPKYMEWYGAFALVVTLVWLYLELLRLLSKLQSRN